MVLFDIDFAFSVHLTAPGHLDQFPLVDLRSRRQNREVSGTVWRLSDTGEEFEEERVLFRDSQTWVEVG